ncbi:MAG: 30S ribosomal protein S8 [Anaplasmataceae bacterium]|nr:30S ribosomal protein S8 [Anaplasmataceae bacterium]
MTINYLFADAVARINNAQAVGNSFVSIYYSRLIEDFVKIIFDEGFILSFETKFVRKGVFTILVHLKYKDKKGVIDKLKIVSSPGCRVYVKAKDANKNKYGKLAVSIISTSKGIISGKKAFEYGIGGEYLCYIL